MTIYIHLYTNSYWFVWIYLSFLISIDVLLNSSWFLFIGFVPSAFLVNAFWSLLSPWKFLLVPIDSPLTYWFPSFTYIHTPYIYIITGKNWWGKIIKVHLCWVSILIRPQTMGTFFCWNQCPCRGGSIQVPGVGSVSTTLRRAKPWYSRVVVIAWRQHSHVVLKPLMTAAADSSGNIWPRMWLDSASNLGTDTGGNHRSLLVSWLKAWFVFLPL